MKSKEKFSPVENMLWDIVHNVDDTALLDFLKSHYPQFEELLRAEHHRIWGPGNRPGTAGGVFYWRKVEDRYESRRIGFHTFK